jgi:DNA-binding transcriptional ArsR family regulator
MMDRPPLAVDPKVEAFVGSANRVRTLAPIANAARPLTAYRIAWLARVPRSKVYVELRRLSESGLVEERKDRKGRSTWTMTDADVAAFLRKKVRIAWSEDVSASVADRAERWRANAAKTASWFDPSKYTANPSVTARIAKEVIRPEGKGEFPGMPMSRRSRKAR